MKVCVISTTVMTCPPAGYSGLEMLAYLQAKGLAAKNHEVLLVAPHGSTVPPGVELHGTTLRESEKRAYSGYWHRLPKYDVVIDNSWEKWAYMLKIEGVLKAPVLGVIHAPPNTMYQKPPPVPKPCIVAISKDQGAYASECWGVSTRVCYNGIDLDHYKPLSIEKTGRYLFLARMSTIKGPHIAIDLANRCRVPLDLVGDDTLTGEPQYVQMIRAQAVNNIKYIGPQNRNECVRWFSQSKALIHSALHYREPFGLAPVEAQACGLPVLSFDNGAMRETIKHGETGFVVKTPDDMERLIKEDAVSSIKPERCREWASQFSYDAMINRYEELCKEAVETGGW